MGDSSFWGRVQDVLSKELFSISDTPVNLATLLICVAVVLATLMFSRLVRKGIERSLGKRGGNAGSIAAVNRLVHYMLVFVGVGIALHTLGVNLSGLFATGAVLAIGLGFAMQNIAQNFVSGIILLAERAIKPGDVLHVDGRVVRVERLGIRSTQVQTRDGEDLIVPNSVLVQSSVTNYTLRDSVYRVWIDVGVVYHSDMKVVHDTLLATASEFRPRVESRDPVVFWQEFGNHSVNFRVGIWISDPWEFRPIRSALHDAVWFALKEQDITIAFPQLDVHFDPPVSEAIAGGLRAAR